MLSFNPTVRRPLGQQCAVTTKRIHFIGLWNPDSTWWFKRRYLLRGRGLITGLEVAANKLGKKLKMKRVPCSTLSFPMAAGWHPLPRRLSAHRCRGIPPKTNLIPRSGRAGTGRAWLQAVPLSAKISRTSAPKGRYLGRVRNPASFHNRFHRQVRPQTLPGSRYPN
jgi:hypothetical protein